MGNEDPMTEGLTMSLLDQLLWMLRLDEHLDGWAIPDPTTQDTPCPPS
jgi:hypothetical protein